MAKALMQKTATEMHKPLQVILCMGIHTVLERVT